MADELLLSVAVEPEECGVPIDGHAADDFVAELVADLNEIDAVLASPASEEEVRAGSKAIGTLLVGVLNAQINGRNALKVLGYLRSKLIDQPHPPLRLKLSRTDDSGAVVAVEVEGAASDREALEALLSRLEASVQRLG
jgi:hypothetical protein